MCWILQGRPNGLVSCRHAVDHLSLTVVPIILPLNFNLLPGFSADTSALCVSGKRLKCSNAAFKSGTALSKASLEILVPVLCLHIRSAAIPN